MAREKLDDLQFVVAVARHRSFGRAAVELGMSRSALSHAVQALETKLGTRLFHRTTRSVAMTEAGTKFVEAISPALIALRSAIAVAGAQRPTPSGTLRINASAGAARQMVPLLVDFIRRFPEMNVDLVTEGRLVDIVAGGFDAGVRIEEAVPKDMVSISLGAELHPMVVGAPAYFEINSKPSVPLDLLTHRCIRSRMASGSIWRWEFERHGETSAVDVQGPFTFDDTELMVEACLAGAGLAYLIDIRANEHLRSGQLIRVLSDWTPSYPGLCLYYSGSRHVPSGLQALVDMIRERCDTVS